MKPADVPRTQRRNVPWVSPLSARHEPCFRNMPEMSPLSPQNLDCTWKVKLQEKKLTGRMCPWGDVQVEETSMVSTIYLVLWMPDALVMRSKAIRGLCCHRPPRIGSAGTKQAMQEGQAMQVSQTLRTSPASPAPVHLLPGMLLSVCPWIC